MKKVGIMGGTFNPIHNRHLFLAEHACGQAGLDYVVFMPTRIPPHKPNENIVSADHRLNMTGLAIEGNPHFVLSDMEIKRSGTTYTADTLRILKENEPGTEYYFIVGADSFMAMLDWMEPRTIFELSTVIVGGRDQYTRQQLDEMAEHIKKSFSGRVIFLDMPLIEISSEMIRERVKTGKSIRYYVPDKVESYIIEHNLYK